MNANIRSRYAAAFVALVVWSANEPSMLRSIVILFAIGLIIWAMHDDNKLEN